MSVKVKIGDILDPRTCWAYETENTERQNKLKLMQKEMKQQWQNSPEIAIKSIAELHRVIILRQEEFCRGELKNVWTENQRVMAKVFLIDYGTTIERIDVKFTVKPLQPHGQISTAPLAFKIILGGIFPVSMDIDWSESESRSGNAVMQQCRAEHWDQSAKDLVEHVINACHREGTFQKTNLLGPTTRVGTLLVGRHVSDVTSEKRQIDLKELLVKKKFAEYSQFEELDERYFDANYGVDTTNISTEEEEDEGDFYNPQPLLMAEQKMASLQLYVSDEANKKDICSSSSSVGLKLGTRRADPTSQSSCSSLQVTGKGPEGGLAGLVDRLRHNIRTDRDSLQGDQNKATEVGDSDQDDIWSQFREREEGKQSKHKSHVMPGGVSVGKRHESILAKIKSNSGQELKKKFRDFVTQ